MRYKLDSFKISLCIFFFCFICSLGCFGYSLGIRESYQTGKQAIEVVRIVEGETSKVGYLVGRFRKIIENAVDSYVSNVSAGKQYLFFNAVKNYSDVVLSVIISICVALVSISATIFIFSKSALDRINDENEYVADVVNIHKRRNMKQLAWICVGSVFLIALPIIWHAFFTFAKDEKYTVQVLIIGLAALVVAILAYFVMTGMFWNNCVCVEKSLKRIIINEFIRLEEILNDILPSEERENRLLLIGDWCCWEDKKAEEYVEVGRELCQNMSQDKFINQFQKAERLLLSGEVYQSITPNSTDIITILQERINILEPNSRVEQEDLKERFYIAKNGNGKNSVMVIEFIRDFEARVGFNVKKNPVTGELEMPLDFFAKTENLYNILKDYRNLLISEEYTQLKINDSAKKQSNKAGENYQRGGQGFETFVEAYYYFFLRILAVFSSSVRIANYSLNGSSLNYANFYSSTLENITLYSAECYRTVFARVKFVHVTMDISRFFDVDFYCAMLFDSSFNNASMENIRFECATVQAGGFDSCDFVSCSLLNSDFTDCIFNNSEFKNVTIHACNFSCSKFREVKWNDVKINGCTFQSAEFYKWDAGNPLELKNCDFSGSVWSKMSIKGWCLDGGIFDSSDLSGVVIKGGSMRSASFLQCRLDGSDISDCDISRSALQNASLFNSKIERTNISTADLLNVIAVKAKFYKCDLRNSNCAEADFSEARIINSKIHAARLYDCAMVASYIEGCQGQYLLADHLQFTFANCKESDFSYSSLSESNLTKSSFSFCVFNGCDLTNMNATQTVFENCRLIGVDFSGTRFVKARFCENRNQKKYNIIRNCNFSSCEFENVQFEHVKFIDCLFDNVIFAGCEIGGDISQPLSKKNFFKISNRSSDSITWL